ncbi:Sister chromatid cohesion protein 2 [Blastocladiella emersonii ATCC 22665]|nr:Sister chromatid cohesion protein 2 [Blastocladiella emersonii ATCC 22665]
MDPRPTMTNGGHTAPSSVPAPLPTGTVFGASPIPAVVTPGIVRVEDVNRSVHRALGRAPLTTVPTDTIKVAALLYAPTEVTIANPGDRWSTNALAPHEFRHLVSDAAWAGPLSAAVAHTATTAVPLMNVRRMPATPTATLSPPVTLSSGQPRLALAEIIAAALPLHVDPPPAQPRPHLPFLSDAHVDSVMARYTTRRSTPAPAPAPAAAATAVATGRAIGKPVRPPAPPAPVAHPAVSTADRLLAPRRRQPSDIVVEIPLSGPAVQAAAQHKRKRLSNDAAPTAAAASQARSATPSSSLPPPASTTPIPDDNDGDYVPDTDMADVAAPSPPPPRPVKKQRTGKAPAKSAQALEHLVSQIRSPTPDPAAIATSLRRNVVSQLVDALTNGLLALSDAEARTLVASCLPLVKPFTARTILRPRRRRPDDGDSRKDSGRGLSPGAPADPSRPHHADEAMDVDDDDDESEDDDDSDAARGARLATLLDSVLLAVDAAQAIVLLYTAYPDTLTTDAVAAIGDLFKNQMLESVVPVLEARERGDVDDDDDYAAKPTRGGAKAKGKGKAAAAAAKSASLPNEYESNHLMLPARILSSNPRLEKSAQSLMHALCALTLRLRNLVAVHAHKAALEEFAISISYGAMAPVFMGTAADPLLQMRGLELVTAVAALRADLRQGIIDEVVANLIHSSSASAGSTGAARRTVRRYKLADGTSIQLATALVLHLIQAAAPSAADLGASMAAASKHVAPPPPLDESKRYAGHVVQYLLARATKKSKSAVTNEADYLALLRAVFEDVVTVLPSPEFPAAELVACITLQLMIPVVEDEGTTDISVKSLAMDIFSSLLCHSRKLTAEHGAVDAKSIARAKRVVAAYLEQAAKGDSGAASALNYLRAEWATLDRANGRVEDGKAAAVAASAAAAVDAAEDDGLDFMRSDDEEDQPVDAAAAPAPQQKDADDTKPLLDVSRAAALEALHKLLVGASMLHKYTEPLLARIVRWFEAKETNVRSRAIKVLSAVGQVDPTIMSQPRVLGAIQARLDDPSPSVRDSVLEVVGKWILGSSGPVNHGYLNILCARTVDRATSVRKRAIKTLGALRTRVEVPDLIEIAVRLFHRISDEETSIADTAKRVLVDIMFPPAPSGVSAAAAATSAADYDPDAASLAFAALKQTQRLDVLSQALVFCGVVARVDADPLVYFLRSDSVTLGLLPPALFHSIQTGAPLAPQTLDALAALAVLARAAPRAVSAEMLTACVNFVTFPMPQQARHAEAINRQSLLALGLFREALAAGERDPDAAAPLASKVLDDLVVSALRVVQWGVLANVRAAVAVACFASRRFSATAAAAAAAETRVQTLLQGATAQLVKCRDALGPDGSGALPAKLSEVHVRRLLAIVGALAQYHAMQQPSSADKGAAAAAVTSDTVFDVLRYFCGPCGLSETTRSSAMQAVGFMTLQFSKLLMLAPMLRLIKGVLDARDAEPLMAEAALDMIVQFMSREDAKAAEKQKSGALDFDRQAFLGTTMEFATSGIAESLAQAFVSDIVACALMDAMDTVRRRVVDLAQEAIGFISLNRLAHPKLVMPAVVALGTSPDSQVAAKARVHHAKLHSQHASTIYDANREAVIAASDYQARVQRSAAPLGYAAASASGESAGVVAHLAPFYAVIRDTKRERRAFLHLLVRFFEWRLQATSTAPPEAVPAAAVGPRRGRAPAAAASAATTAANDGMQGVPTATDVGRCRWLADNLATLEFKHEDEVLAVIQTANRVVSSVAVAVQVDLERQLHAASNSSGAATPISPDAPTSPQRETAWPLAELVRAAAVSAMLVAAKGYLTRAFGLSAAKVRNFRDTPAAATGRGAIAKSVARRDEVPAYVCPVDDAHLAVLASATATAAEVEAIAAPVHALLEGLLDQDPALHDETAAAAALAANGVSIGESMADTSSDATSVLVPTSDDPLASVTAPPPPPPPATRAKRAASGRKAAPRRKASGA